MKNEELLGAIGKIDDEFIADAAFPSEKRSSNRFPRLAVAACFVMLLSVGFIAGAVFGSSESKPELSAYAVGEALGEVVKNDMHGSEPTEISRFVTDNGVDYFVFSNEAEDKNAPPKVVINVEDDNYSNIGKLDAVDKVKGNIYYYYIPSYIQTYGKSAGDSAEFRGEIRFGIGLMKTSFDPAEDIGISISEKDGKYYASLTSEK